MRGGGSTRNSGWGGATGSGGAGAAGGGVMALAPLLRDLDALGYRYGTDWLPHDAVNKDPKSGKNTVQVLRALGRRHIRLVGRDNVEDGIRHPQRIGVKALRRRRRAQHVPGGNELLCGRAVDLLIFWLRFKPPRPSPSWSI